MNKTLVIGIATLVLFSNCLAQNELELESTYFTTVQGLNLMLNNERIGTTPVNFSIPIGNPHLLKFQRSDGRELMRITIQARKTDDLTRINGGPNWISQPSAAIGRYNNYRLVHAQASSRSLSISINKAFTSGVTDLAQQKSGTGRDLSRQAPSRISDQMPEVVILECFILYDNNSYLTHLLIGEPN